MRSPLRDNTPHTLTSSRARRYTLQRPNHPAPNSNRAPTRTPPTATSQSPRCPQQCASRHDLHTALVLPHARLHAHVMGSRTSFQTQSAHHRISPHTRPSTTRRSLHILRTPVRIPPSAPPLTVQQLAARRSPTARNIHLRSRSPTPYLACATALHFPHSSTPTTQLSSLSPSLPPR